MTARSPPSSALPRKIGVRSGSPCEPSTIRNQRASAVAPATPATTPRVTTPLSPARNLPSVGVARGGSASFEVTLEDIDPNSQDERNGNGGHDQATPEHPGHQTVVMHAPNT